MEIEIKDGDKVEYKAPEMVARLFREVLANENEIDRDKEHTWVMGLNTKNNVKYIELVTLGILDASLLHPREIFRMAIMKGVKSIIVVHNHPSGSPQPSGEDLRMTKQLSEAGKLMGIPLLDHVIITLDGHFSFQEAGLL